MNVQIKQTIWLWMSKMPKVLSDHLWAGKYLRLRHLFPLGSLVLVTNIFLSKKRRLLQPFLFANVYSNSRLLIWYSFLPMQCLIFMGRESIEYFPRPNMIKEWVVSWKDVTFSPDFALSLLWQWPIIAINDQFISWLTVPQKQQGQL